MLQKHFDDLCDLVRFNLTFTEKISKQCAELIAHSLKIPNWLLEQHVAAEDIKTRGFVPHELLLPYLEEIKQLSPEDDGAVDRFVGCIWPELSLRILDELKGISIDIWPYRLLEQMIRAHGAGYYDIVLAAFPRHIESCYRHAETWAPDRSLKKWLKMVVPNYYADEIGWVLGANMCRVLDEECLSQVYTDEDAESQRFPNRHQLAHGVGKRTPVAKDSLNAILLSAFAFQIAFKAKDSARDLSEHDLDC